MSERCRHGLVIGTCSFCLGHEQTYIEKGIGTPPWFINSTQLALQSQYIQHKIRGYTGDELREMMPRGSRDKNVKDKLPYRKWGHDPKTRHQYEIQKRKDS